MLVSTRKYVTSIPQLHDRPVAVQQHRCTVGAKIWRYLLIIRVGLWPGYGGCKALHDDAYIKVKGVVLEVQDAGCKPGPGGVGSALIGVGLHGLLLALPTT